MSNQRNTLQKEIVKQALLDLDHPTAEQMYDHMKSKYPSISKATFYRNIKSMTEKGNAIKIDLPGMASRYDYRTAVHGHGICTICSRLSDIEISGDMTKGLSGYVNDSNGFDIDGAQILFYGICSACKKVSKKSQPSQKNKD